MIKKRQLFIVCYSTKDRLDVGQCIDIIFCHDRNLSKGDRIPYIEKTDQN